MHVFVKKAESGGFQLEQFNGVFLCFSGGGGDDVHSFISRMKVKVWISYNRVQLLSLTCMELE